LTLHAPLQLIYPERLRNIEGRRAPLCRLRQLGFACSQSRGDVRPPCCRVGPLCRSTPLEAHSQHETAKDAPQSLAREHLLPPSFSPRCWGAVASQRLPPTLTTACMAIWDALGFGLCRRYPVWHTRCMKTTPTHTRIIVSLRQLSATPSGCRAGSASTDVVQQG
jgi:hypothetical protein